MLATAVWTFDEVVTNVTPWRRCLQHFSRIKALRTESGNAAFEPSVSARIQTSRQVKVKIEFLEVASGQLYRSGTIIVMLEVSI